MQYRPHDNCIYGEGGRISSQNLRDNQQYSEQFEGLCSKIKPFELLTLCKRAGKAGGFTHRMVSLLEYYMKFTREADWRDGHRPIVFQSLTKTALDMGVSERQVQRLEQQLHERGALSWNDSGNHRRYGRRNEISGHIDYAFGVDLSPLGALHGELRQAVDEKNAHDDAWMEKKRQISFYRRQIKARIGEGEEKMPRDESIHQSALCLKERSKPIRTYMKLDYLIELSHELRDLLKFVDGLLRTLSQKMSRTDDKNVVNNKDTNNNKSNKLESNKKLESSEEKIKTTEPEPALTEHKIRNIGLNMVKQAGSNDFNAMVLMLNDNVFSWRGVIECANYYRKKMAISQLAWSTACDTLGRYGAAVSILIIDQAMRRQESPVIHAERYLATMITRARGGDLKLHASIFKLMGSRSNPVHV